MINPDPYIKVNVFLLPQKQTQIKIIMGSTLILFVD